MPRRSPVITTGSLSSGPNRTHSVSSDRSTRTHIHSFSPLASSLNSTFYVIAALEHKNKRPFLGFARFTCINRLHTQPLGGVRLRFRRFLFQTDELSAARHNRPSRQFANLQKKGVRGWIGSAAGHRGGHV